MFRLELDREMVCDIEKGTRCKDSFPDYIW